MKLNNNIQDYPWEAQNQGLLKIGNLLSSFHNCVSKYAHNLNSEDIRNVNLLTLMQKRNSTVKYSNGIEMGFFFKTTNLNIYLYLK